MANSYKPATPFAQSKRTPTDSAPQHSGGHTMLSRFFQSVGMFVIASVTFVIVSLVLMSIFTSQPHASGTIAVVPIQGVLHTGQSSFGSGDSTSSATIVDYLSQIRQDPDIQAVILEINSPGGSAVASDEISIAIKQLNKPVVSYIRDVGASGAYWVASSTEFVVSHPASIVGSIGVIASYIEFSQLLTRWNMTYQRFVAGENKDFGSPFIAPTLEQKTAFNNQLNQLHDLFIQTVATNRNMSESSVRLLADGSIYTGTQAKATGLVDELGGLHTVKEYLNNTYNITGDLVVYSYDPTFLDVLSGYGVKLFESIGIGVAKGMVSQQSLRISY
jgi:protease IV